MTNDLTDQRTWLKLGQRGSRMAAEGGHEAAKRARAAADRARQSARDLDPADLASIARPFAEGVADAVATMPDRIRSMSEDLAQLRPEDLKPDQLRASASRLVPGLARRSPSRLPVVIMIAIAAAAGAAISFLFDPDRGRSRRAEAADRLNALTRQARRTVGRVGQDARATVAGMQAEHARSGDTVQTLDDATLAHKVESELFRDPAVPKGQMNINAENGVVILRGRVASNDAIEQVMAATLSVEGVRIVRSLLRTQDDESQTSDGRELVRTRSGS